MLSGSQGLFVVAAIFGTSILSGVFGMAGGLILMGVLATMLPVPLAMTAHGFAQLIANGTRFLSLLKNVDWRSSTYYVGGVSVAAGLFWFVSFSPSRAVLFIVLGSIPLLSLLPWAPQFDFQKPLHAIVCGFLNTVAHLTAGVSGPVLDLFFVHSKMNRFEVVATKAFTQTLGHALKIGYFGSLASALMDVPLWLPIGVAVSAVAGTFVGGMILRRLSDANFRLYLRRLFVVIGTVYLVRGLWDLLS